MEAKLESLFVPTMCIAVAFVGRVWVAAARRRLKIEGATLI
jgi:hypothetical protein